MKHLVAIPLVLLMIPFIIILFAATAAWLVSGIALILFASILETLY